ncbi:MAG: DUF1729 domain-containing protein [Solirubrobacteraceae bacterium]|nr:DUF1729 domain-containing protein [Solirubrobacteraceae bacterium]
MTTDVARPGAPTAPGRSRPRGRLSPVPLVQRIATGDVPVAITFAGLGADALDEIATLAAADPAAHARLRLAGDVLADLCATPTASGSGRYAQGIDVAAWALDPDGAPDADYLRSAAIAYPLHLLAQVLLWDAVAEDGLADALTAHPPVAVAGHSQGLIAATLVAELAADPAAAWRIDDARLARHLRHAWALGLALADAAGDHPRGGLVALTGDRAERLADAVEASGATHDRPARVALVNGPQEIVVAGSHDALRRLRHDLDARVAADAAARRDGRTGGRPLTVTWTPLPGDVPFHTPDLAGAVRRLADGIPVADDAADAAPDPARRAADGADGRPVATVREHGVPTTVPDAVPLLGPDGADLSATADPVAALLAAHATAPVRWDRVCGALVDHGARWVLDLGPGVAVARHTGDALQGTGARAVGLASPDGRRVLSVPASAPEDDDVRWADLAPRVVRLPDGRRHVDTRYTRLTGRPPVVLAGMTPTTVDAPIVAAAANAGYAAELAGGGQRDARTLEERLRELAELLDPGRDATFNTLLLDRHLWALHIERDERLFRARDRGAPLAGVTVSAGVPDVEDAIALLDRLAAHGLRLNAFKPGTPDGIARTLAIADAAPHHVLQIQIEGGQGGGHHSWEDLEDLLLDHYAAIRRRDNLILVVGGGIGTPERARDLLTGTWSARHGRPPMPVDAILVGTAAMACAEATAAPRVKRALVAATGSDDWVPRNGVAGGVTSATSNLNADIHLLENSAARAGKLLQEVAGDADAVAARRDEIVAALAPTAKPYLGDIDAMTYAELLRRVTDRMATGRGGRYEDGAWGHPSWRARTLALHRRFAARLDPAQDGVVDPPVATGADLDDPDAAIDALVARYPHATTTLLHPADVQFVLEVCDRPGKPVPFVPVLDGQVRRWFMADALWQAQDDRHDADAVFVIPGPHAVGGITRADEPVADLLRRFEAATVEHLLERGVAPDERDRLAAPGPAPRAVADIADGRHGPVAGLLLAPSVLTAPDARTTIVNPLWSLVRPGDDVRTTVEDGRLTAVDVRPGGGRDAERVRVEEAADGTVVVQVDVPDPDGRPRTLRLVHRPGAVPGSFALVDGPAARAAWARDVLAAGADPSVTASSTPASADAPAPAGPPAAPAAAYRRTTGARHDGAPIDRALTLVWPAFVAALTAEDAVAARLAELVHVRHEVTTGPAWPPADGSAPVVDARIVRLDDPDGAATTLELHGLLSDGDGRHVARVVAELQLLGPAAVTDDRARTAREHRGTLAPLDAAAIDLLADRPGVTVVDGAGLRPGDRLDVDVRTTLVRARDADVAHVTAEGALSRDGAVVARVALDDATPAGDRPAPRHPVDALLDALAPAAPPRHQRPRHALATVEDLAPDDATPFARIGGDHNPLHRSVLAARLAGLDAPIVHGAWTAARASAFVVDAVAGGDATALERWSVRFLAPVATGALLRFDATRTGVRDGRLLVEVRVRADDVDVALGEAELSLLRIRRRALVLPGQGTQRPGMGTAQRDRSAAARRTWERADAIVREHLGYGLLDVVERNPASLRLADGRALRHPAGVLHRTEITQVAIVAQAAAQIAELREAGVLPADPVDPGMLAVAGHSVGELSALHALGVLDLEAALLLVHARGEAMQRCVPRTADGTSPYALAVVDPAAAGTDEAGLQRTVAALGTDDDPLHVVNHNAPDRQYAVVGTIAALRRLGDALPARAGGRGTPVRTLPGVDVPFHSPLLRPAAAAMRDALEARIGTVDHRRLVGRWAPNLVGRTFTLDDAFVAAVADAAGEPVPVPGLHDPEGRARALLIALLAHQVAAPVRWIDTQRTLAAPTAVGGHGIGELVEVSPGHASVLTGLARLTLAPAATPGVGEGDADPTDPAVAILHVEADRDRVLEQDVVAEPEGEGATPPDAGSPTAASGGPAPSGPPPSAAPVSADGPPGSDGPIHPVDAGDALLLVLALQARVRAEQIAVGETIDELFQGVSSRRNQVLIDLGRELSLSGAEGAQQQPVGELVATLRERGERYRFPGPYLREAIATGVTRALGRSGLGRDAALAHLAGTWGLDRAAGERVLATVALDGRPGPSSRGGQLARLDDASPTTADAARALLDRAVTLTAADLGVRVARTVATATADAPTGPTVVAGHVEDALLDAARTLADGLRRPFAPDGDPVAAPDPDRERLAALDAELGVARAAELAPAFDARRHVRIDDAWSRGRWELVRVAHDALAGRRPADETAADLRRLTVHGTVPETAATARWLADVARGRGDATLADALELVAVGGRPAVPVAGVRPDVPTVDTGAPRPRTADDPTRPADVVTGLRGVAGRSGAASGGPGGPVDPDAATARSGAPATTAPAPPVRLADPTLAAALADRLDDALDTAPDLSGEVALVTGAGPGSIGEALVRRLLRAGATVVVTSSRLTRARRRAFRDLYHRDAAPGAALHLLPANLAAFADVDALVDWLADPPVQQRRRPDLAFGPLVPTILAPLAAVPTEGDLADAGADAEVALRLQLLGVERLIGGVAGIASARRPVTVLLPLSPNHGTFGGDGPYAETKAALEVLAQRWSSEHGRWGERVALVPTRIGWVRGTGLMTAADAVADAVEAAGARTFTTDEAAWILEGLAAGPVADAARHAPVTVDATGGLDAVTDLRGRIADAITALEDRAAHAARRDRLARALDDGPATPDTTVRALPSPDTDRDAERRRFTRAGARGDVDPGPAVDPADLVVIVGAGELGPGGTGATRFALEHEDDPSPGVVAELAWLCGLVDWDVDGYRGRWTDAETRQDVTEEDLADRYADAVRERVGLRPLEDDGTIDPAGHEVHAPVAVDRPLSFTVADRATAETFVAADPDGTTVTVTPDGEHRVTLRAGAQIRVRRTVAHARRVAGMLPRGLDPARWGVPDDLVAGADRMALVNLVSTVQAFTAAGVEPEELLEHAHPTRVANTQGCGLGGMWSLRRLLLDHMMDRERQPDRIQESLGNVVAAHVVQAYVGSYGPMVHPVGACATAAVSLEEAHDKIRAGKALAVLAGGFDDLTPEGLIGFGDMGATASSDDLDAAGIDPVESSRPGDLRRRGFVESQGGGALLVVRGDVALDLGLPVRGVLAYAGTFADGLQRSIPAPGLGVLGAATGGPDSPLGRGLAALGLTADDVALVSKHDTSTEMNDPHEADVHHRIQDALGRTPGNPLLVVSQKSLTGHSKGGAAAWQVDGVLRTFDTGIVPGNRTLECADPLLRASSHLVAGDRPIHLAEPPRAALVTSLGFGHVGGLIALAHPSTFVATIPVDRRDDYLARAGERRARGAQALLAARHGRPLVRRRDGRRLPDGDDATVRDAEAAVLLDPAARLVDGTLRPGEGRHRT